ncbi:transcriptional regulator, TetR family [Marinitoga hydrogenitolerans DSM 16785]|uniref:Transcriptional regulator, TetR family n=1 Tax=Marinitoga hydrogenitolerans (strain DSM 16785 / JCM 12826 / AT1271) TaxID=1122195 RepID=A0A1M4TDC2_MARH1|nr:TetR/AcrR family transcriptional regulator [Marinitoga hydrogenitolerans]SHE42365.1 transcriptional regulator, TetR family [Marinitoga hydrogenitolerans DSM 16785]
MAGNISEKKSNYKEQKKRKIAENALDLILSKGLSHFTMDDVAKETGVSKGTLYLYFDSKDSLIITSFGILVERLKYYLSNLLPQETSKEEKAKAIIKLYSKIIKEFPSDDLLRLFEILINSIHDKKRLKELGNLFHDYYTQLFDLWSEFVPNKTTAIILQAMIDGIGIYKSVGVEFKEEELCSSLEYIIGKLMA